MKNFRRILALTLALLMAAAVLSGCGDTTTGVSSGSSSVAQSTGSSQAADDPQGGPVPNNIPADMPVFFKETPENLEYMDDLSPISFTIFYNQLITDPWTWGENTIEKTITEMTGVSLEGTFAADADGNQLTLMIAGGDKLPDIISSLDPNSLHMNDLIVGDLIYPINQLIDEYCPKMYDVRFPIENTYYNDENGDFWYIGRQQIMPNLPNYNVPNGWFGIRQDVYEELGSPTLSNFDDVWAYLELWEENKEKWPEIIYPWADEVLTGSGSIAVAYGMLGGKARYSGGSYCYYDADLDNIVYQVDTELGKEALRFYYDLAQAGYIDQQSFAFAGFSAEVQAGSALIFAKTNIWEITIANNLSALEQNVPGATYVRGNPICADSVDFHYYDAPFRAAPNATVITKDCHNPERAIKFFEFMSTEYGNLLVTSGVYKEHWDVITLDNGLVAPEAIGEAADANFRAAEGIYNYNKHWWSLVSNYDSLTLAADAKEDPVRMNNMTIRIDNSKSFAPNAVSFEAGSDEQILQNRIQEIIQTSVTKIILAADEASFNALYDEMIANLYSSGLEDLCAALRELSVAFIDELTASGMKWVD